MAHAKNEQPLCVSRLHSCALVAPCAQTLLLPAPIGWLCPPFIGPRSSKSPKSQTGKITVKNGYNTCVYKTREKSSTAQFEKEKRRLLITGRKIGHLMLCIAQLCFLFLMNTLGDVKVTIATAAVYIPLVISVSLPESLPEQLVGCLEIRRCTEALTSHNSTVVWTSTSIQECSKQYEAVSGQ